MLRIEACICATGRFALDLIWSLILEENQLTTSTLPPDLTKAGHASPRRNPAYDLRAVRTDGCNEARWLVASLQSQGVSVFTYPLTVQWSSHRALLGAFSLESLGPPGVYALLGSTILRAGACWVL